MIHHDVAAGILIDTEHRVLIAERVCDGPFDGLWEFPGGKISAGESSEQALVRELVEEIGVVVNDFSSFMRLEHKYIDRKVRIEFFKVHAWSGEPRGVEGQELRWIIPSAIEAGLMLPADEPIVEALLAGPD